MDNTEITCISLCSGYEGLGIGIKRVIPNLRIILYSEIEFYVCQVLVDLMETGQIDAAPIWTNLKTLQGKDFHGKVDFITAGYPCQPFSQVGKRKGKEDERHLWPHIKRIIEEVEPKGVFFENVEGHVSLGASEVLDDLETMGFRVEAGLFSAAEVGAPHKRKRLFILGMADAESSELQRSGNAWKRRNGFADDRWPARPGQEQFEWEEQRII